MMDEHLALALKYRPKTFSDVIGQPHVVEILKNAITSGRIANAYLFIGPRGIGKTTLSRIFAKALNCTSPNGVEPCGECANCREIAEGRSLDVIELDAASHNSVDDVKPIIESVQFKPASSKYKIYIVDECHMLSNAAWNALLKTLEEPPPHVKFVFATTEGDKVLATIVSRCQRFDLRRIQTKDIVSRLEGICKVEGIKAHPDALLAIARGADGGMRDALSSLDQLVSFKGTKISEEDALGVFGLVSRKELENLAGAVLAGDVAAVLKGVDRFESAGKNMRRLAGELMSYFRNLVVVKSVGDGAIGLGVPDGQLETLKGQAESVEPSRLFRICDLLAQMEDRLRYVLSVRTVMEMSLMRASRIATTATIDELLRAVKAMKAAPAGESPQAAVPSAPKKEEPKKPETMSRRQILSDPKLDAIMSSMPGASIINIKEPRRQ
ncbi:MAG: DNA polymerase III subunit gamma/tau [Kiritimatiellae bacterium]|nr:DNA polymerase III subunit gamma/tau [Kiritimatiellia bacterium]